MPNFGFRFNAIRDGYEVDDEAMQVVRRVFYLVGVEGMTLNGAGGVLRGEGVPTPGGKKLWTQTTIRMIKNDVYKAHILEEVKGLVAPDVASRLDPDRRYGLWWFNRRRVASRQTTESTSEGRRYRKRTKTTHKPESEWIAVPVPDAGLPREWVDAARATIKDNRKSSSNSNRFWELSGGIAWCGLCGAQMRTTVVSRSNGQRYFYYRCRRRMKFNEEGALTPRTTRRIE